MRQDYCHISVVLDRSGSMGFTVNDTIGGFNTFLKAQQALPGKATITLVQFDDQYESKYNHLPVKDAPYLNTSTYIPRGSTALLDAVGRTITETGQWLKDMPEWDRPAKVIFLIITDGQENASKEYTKARIKDMIRTQEEVYKWEVVYIGADAEAFSEAYDMGVVFNKSLKFVPTAAGTNHAYQSMTMNASNYRSGVTANMDWTTEDRKAQDDLGADNLTTTAKKQ